MKLITPGHAYYASCLEAIQEYADHQVTGYSFLNPAQCDVAERVARFKTGKGLPPGYVKATYLWLVDEGRFLGETSIRHRLTPSLLRYGGHIGYGIRHNEWGRGLGTAMLAMSLGYAKDHLGFNRVLITCDDDNLASARVIEKNGGILQDKIKNTVGGKAITTRRYWVDIP
jgi:predicted acetyltransferase